MPLADYTMCLYDMPWCQPILEPALMSILNITWRNLLTGFTYSVKETNLFPKKISRYTVLCYHTSAVIYTVFVCDVWQIMYNIAVSLPLSLFCCRCCVVEIKDGQMDLSLRASRIGEGSNEWLGEKGGKEDPEVTSLQDLAVGKVLRGYVKAVTDVGVFVR